MLNSKSEFAKSIQFDNFSYFTKYIKNTIWMLSFKDIVKAKQTIKQGDIVTYGNQKQKKGRESQREGERKMERLRENEK